MRSTSRVRTLHGHDRPRRSRCRRGVGVRVAHVRAVVGPAPAARPGLVGLAAAVRRWRSRTGLGVGHRLDIDVVPAVLRMRGRAERAVPGRRAAPAPARTSTRRPGDGGHRAARRVLGRGRPRCPVHCRAAERPAAAGVRGVRPVPPGAGGGRIGRGGDDRVRGHRRGRGSDPSRPAARGRGA